MLTNIWRRVTDCSAPVTANPDGIDVFDASYDCGICDFDLAAATYDTISLGISSEDTSPFGLVFSTDGLSMYFIGSVSNTVYQYTLGTAWNLATALYSGKSFDTSSEDTSPFSLAFSYTGDKLYILGDTSDLVYQYTLSTPWDISTASYDSKSFDVTSEDASPSSIDFSQDGTKLYYLGASNNTVYQYTLSTAWDVSTASYDTVSLDLTTESAFTVVVKLSKDGTRLYMLDNDGEGATVIYQYTLLTAWDLSTASYDTISLDVASPSVDTNGFAVSKDSSCTKLYVIDSSTDTIYQYS